MRASILFSLFVFSFLAILECEVEANKHPHNKIKPTKQPKIYRRKEPRLRQPRPPRKHGAHHPPPPVIPPPVVIPNDQGVPVQPEPVSQPPTTPVIEPPPILVPPETPKEEEPTLDAEMPPNPEVNELIEKFSMEIKSRANLAVQNEQDAEDFKVAPVEALSFIKIVNGSNEIFLVKVIIGNEYVVHVKIGRTKKKDGDGYDNVALMTEIPDKEDKDPLSKEEFGIK